MTEKESVGRGRHVDVVRGDDTYRFFEDGSVELTRRGVGAGVATSSIQDENVIQKTAISGAIKDPVGDAIRLGRTDIGLFGQDSILKEFRTTAAPGAVFDRKGNHVRGGPPEVTSAKKKWKDIAAELRYLEGYIAHDLRREPEVKAFYGDGAGG
jgi:hypothetical protein